MGLGVCCHWLESVTKPNGSVSLVNTIKETPLQLGKHSRGLYTPTQVLSTYKANVKSLASVIPKLKAAGIDNFRMSSSMLPLLDKYHTLASSDEEFMKALHGLGAKFMAAGIRVTTHPGQFTVLSSDNPTVVKNSIQELTMQAWVFDSMGFPQTPFHAINVHGGKANRAAQLVQATKSLPQNARSRLTFENDECCYSVSALLSVFEKTGVPVVFDSHHHTFNHEGMPAQVAYELSLYTWRRAGFKALQHVSNSVPGVTESASFQDRRKHSDFIANIPDCQLDGLNTGAIDLDVEAKMKNLAVVRLKGLLRA